jgi:hypothetical protein
VLAAETIMPETRITHGQAPGAVEGHTARIMFSLSRAGITITFAAQAARQETRITIQLPRQAAILYSAGTTETPKAETSATQAADRQARKWQSALQRSRRQVERAEQLPMVWSRCLGRLAAQRRAQGQTESHSYRAEAVRLLAAVKAQNQ